jgi:pyruvate dehydrogenase E2 component (dihydrolipoamide acetyltransferase)
MDVKLPHLGEGADSGAVVGILVKVGDTVKKGQILIELESDKAVAPIPAPAAGKVVKIHVREGQRVGVGQLVLSLAGVAAAEAAAPAEPAPTPRKASPAKIAKAELVAEPEPVAMEAQPPAEESASESAIESEPESESSGKASALTPPASPSIRKMARELGIDLARIMGSEYGGRIMMKDLRDYIQRLQKLALAPEPAVPAEKPVAPSIDFSQWGPITRQPLTPLRGTISRRMLENWNTIPHVTQFDEADVTTVQDLRKKYQKVYESKGVRLTMTTFILKAIVMTLQKHPIFNSSLDEAGRAIVFKQYYHLGLAVDTDAGLIVPVIRDVDKKDLVTLSREIQVLAEKARARKVSADELKGGTFTLSNQGGIGGAHFTPIVNKPEVAILGLGKAAIKPVVRNGKIEPRTLAPLGLSYDHRVIDGGAAARFITDLVQAIEQFDEAMVKLK